MPRPAGPRPACFLAGCSLREDPSRRQGAVSRRTPSRPEGWRLRTAALLLAATAAGCPRSVPADSVAYLQGFFEDLRATAVAEFGRQGVLAEGRLIPGEIGRPVGEQLARALGPVVRRLAPLLEAELVPQDFLDVNAPRVQLWLREMGYLFLEDTLLRERGLPPAYRIVRTQADAGGRSVLQIVYQGRMLGTVEPPPSDVQIALLRARDGWRIDVASFPLLDAGPFDPSADLLQAWLVGFRSSQASRGWRGPAAGLWLDRLRVRGFRSEKDELAGAARVRAAFEAAGVRITGVQTLHFRRTPGGLQVQAVETHSGPGWVRERRAVYDLVWDPSGLCTLAQVHYLL